MALPIVTAVDQTILLGTTIELQHLFTFSDADNDAPLLIQIRDNNNNANSGYFTFNGVVQPPNTVLTFAYSDLNKLVYHAGTAITKEQIDIRVNAGGEWSAFASFLMYSVKPNVTRPNVSVVDRTVIQSEEISIAEAVGFNDPDGYPVNLWRIRELNGAAFSGSLVLNGVTLTPGVFRNLTTQEFGQLVFKAAVSAPNQDIIEIRAFDGADWSFVQSFNAFTTVNFNKPVVLPTEYQMATDATVAMEELFRVTDADGNTIKKLRFWDTAPHVWSGHIVLNGVEQPARQFIEISAANLPNMQWYSSSLSYLERILVQAFDGNHWSDLQTVRVQTNERPRISVADDYSVREELEFVSLKDLVVKLDNGPIYTQYEVYDATPSSLSGTFRMGTSVLPALTVHNVTATQFQNLEFKTGVHEVRSLDEIYVRAFNGTFWSDWTRHTVRTEPDYVDSLAAGSWLDFLSTAGDGRLKMTYSFMETYPTYMQGEGAIPNEFMRPWVPMRNLIRQAFVRMSEIVKVDFEEVPDNSAGIFGEGGIIRMGSYCLDNVGASDIVAYAFFPGADPINGDIMFNRFHMGGPFSPPPPDPYCPSTGDGTNPFPFVPFDAWDLGDFNYFVMLHEFGHTMGLRHPNDIEGPPPVLPGATANGNFTVMAGNNTSGGFNPRGPMLYDVAALQDTYGASSFNTGNTIYNRAYFRNTWNIADVIWDTGGTDTIVASDEIADSHIDLRPGSFQSIGGVANNLAIAFNVNIENATTGSGNDTLIGNESVNRLIAGEGHDTLQGYAGNDYLSGNKGWDTYIYNMFDGRDLIDENFGNGVDKLQVGLFLGLDNFTDDLSFSKIGRDLLIDFTIDNSVSRGSIQIKNHQLARDAVETLEVLGKEIDLEYLYTQITSANQKFAVSATMGTYGLLVAPA